jgi:hypothetical protein
MATPSALSTHTVLPGRESLAWDFGSLVARLLCGPSSRDPTSPGRDGCSSIAALCQPRALLLQPRESRSVRPQKSQTPPRRLGWLRTRGNRSCELPETGELLRQPVTKGFEAAASDADWTQVGELVRSGKPAGPGASFLRRASSAARASSMDARKANDVCSPFAACIARNRTCPTTFTRRRVSTSRSRIAGIAASSCQRLWMVPSLDDQSSACASTSSARRAASTAIAASRSVCCLRLFGAACPAPCATRQPEGAPTEARPHSARSVSALGQPGEEYRSGSAGERRVVGG